MNWYDKKSRKVISTIIIVIVVLAMILPMLTYACKRSFRRKSGSYFEKRGDIMKRDSY